MAAGTARVETRLSARKTDFIGIGWTLSAGCRNYEFAGLFDRFAGHVRTSTPANRKWLFIKKRLIRESWI
jgi:hypothetical protein